MSQASGHFVASLNCPAGPMFTPSAGRRHEDLGSARFAVTEFALAVARHHEERVVRAVGVVPLNRLLTSAPAVGAPVPEGDAAPAALAHREVFRSIEASLERLCSQMATDAAPAQAVVPMLAPARPTSATMPSLRLAHQHQHRREPQQARSAAHGCVP